MKHRDSEQQANLFMAIMKEAEKETGMMIVFDDRQPMLLLDTVSNKVMSLNDVYQQDTLLKSTSKNMQKYQSRKNKQ